jgi:hypothetical protein
MPNKKMVIMTRYELILKCKKENIFTNLVGSGIISITTASWFDVYENFLKQVEESKDKSKKQRYVCVTNVVEVFKISERQVYKIISFMEN